jgi:hypothetical protein
MEKSALQLKCRFASNSMPQGYGPDAANRTERRRPQLRCFGGERAAKARQKYYAKRTRRYDWSYYPYWRPYQYRYWQLYYPYGGPLF